MKKSLLVLTMALTQSLSSLAAEPLRLSCESEINNALKGLGMPSLGAENYAFSQGKAMTSYGEYEANKRSLSTILQDNKNAIIQRKQIEQKIYPALYDAIYAGYALRLRSKSAQDFAEIDAKKIASEIASGNLNLNQGNVIISLEGAAKKRLNDIQSKLNTSRDFLKNCEKCTPEILSKVEAEVRMYTAQIEVGLTDEEQELFDMSQHIRGVVEKLAAQNPGYSNKSIWIYPASSKLYTEATAQCLANFKPALSGKESEELRKLMYQKNDLCRSLPGEGVRKTCFEQEVKELYNTIQSNDPEVYCSAAVGKLLAEKYGKEKAGKISVQGPVLMIDQDDRLSFITEELSDAGINSTVLKINLATCNLEAVKKTYGSQGQERQITTTNLSDLIKSHADCGFINLNNDKKRFCQLVDAKIAEVTSRLAQ